MLADRGSHFHQDYTKNVPKKGDVFEMASSSFKIPQK